MEDCGARRDPQSPTEVMSVEAIFSIEIREALQLRNAGALRFGGKEPIKDLIGVLRASSPSSVSVTDTP